MGVGMGVLWWPWLAWAGLAVDHAAHQNSPARKNELRDSAVFGKAAGKASRCGAHAAVTPDEGDNSTIRAGQVCQKGRNATIQTMDETQPEATIAPDLDNGMPLTSYDAAAGYRPNSRLCCVGLLSIWRTTPSQRTELSTGSCQ